MTNVGIGEQLNSGVASYVQQTPGAIGYVEYAYALQTSFTNAALLNKSRARFVKPSITSASAAAGPHATNLSAANFNIVNEPGAAHLSAGQLQLVAHLPEAVHHQHRASRWASSSTGWRPPASAMPRRSGYAPLPANVRAAGAHRRCSTLQDAAGTAAVQPRERRQPPRGGIGRRAGDPRAARRRRQGGARAPAGPAPGPRSTPSSAGPGRPSSPPSSSVLVVSPVPPGVRRPSATWGCRILWRGLEPAKDVYGAGHLHRRHAPHHRGGAGHRRAHRRRHRRVALRAGPALDRRAAAPCWSTSWPPSRASSSACGGSSCSPRSSPITSSRS